MNRELPIAALITKRQADLHFKPADVVRRAGYGSVNGGLRRLADLLAGDLSPRTRFLVDALPHAIDVPAAVVQEAITATMDQIEKAQRARAEEEERRYRERFRPHGIWVTEYSRPTSIVMASFAGIERLLAFKLDTGRGQETFVAQALAAMPSSIPFFGKAMGFTINYTADRAMQYDAQGNVVATFPRAHRLPEADVTLRGDSRSILPLFGVNAPDPCER